MFFLISFEIQHQLDAQVCATCWAFGGVCISFSVAAATSPWLSGETFTRIIPALLLLLLKVIIQKKKPLSFLFSCALSQPTLLSPGFSISNQRKCCLAPPTEVQLSQLISASRRAPLLMFVEFRLQCVAYVWARTHTDLQNHFPDCSSSGGRPLFVC